MNNREYEEFKNQITSEKLKENIELYYSRLSEVYNDNKIIEGLDVASRIRKIIQKVLFEEGCKYIWLVPIETSIDEYSTNNFIAYNPYNKRSYSLVQSPQIQKEAAAIVLGSNFRLVDCYRGEKADTTHANIFQQIDVEFANKTEYEIRKVGKKIIEECFKEILNIDINIVDTYSYKELVELYGTDNPNLGLGFKICKTEKQYFLLVPNEYLYSVHKMVNNLNFCYLDGNKLMFKEEMEINDIRIMRNEFINKLRDNINNNTLYGYWVVNMPYAECKNGILKPTHHVMSMPSIAHEDNNFSFDNLSDSELCNLNCNSFDLIICNNSHAVEVLGGDERISDFSLQYSAIKRLGYNVEQYAYLLEALRFNENHDKKRLGGFAIGAERLVQFLIGCYDMKYVQLFPTNLPNGILTHATSIEDMKTRRKKL